MTPLQQVPLRRGVTDRLHAAVPSASEAVVGTLLWGAAMGASALASLLLAGWETPDRIRFVALLYVLGGMLAFPVGLTLARLASRGRQWETAFAAAFVWLLAATLAFTGGLFALQYRSYYAEWHAPAFTLTWAFEFAFTMLTALYQFVVLGVRLYFPLGFAALVGVSIWFTRQRR
ncbi:hypothetical protein [Mesorhizobium humile]|jgi:hypothetical protein|uniref:Uncharacterized protein n=1 Tax=Mesorhizobium humile TaxID=3072313 RepID=A0ABU4YJY5_9HYPH|nr:MULTISPECIES: hypothetical protein [unclassified Mesorhizobium]MDX8460282.1 hypothetical protein [Mesorhizobium sp. VK2D]MDX8487259.1 hypothetical protein [Mesorhizobium sp. VK2B]